MKSRRAVVRPLDVLEHEDERMLLGQRLEETAPRRERLLLASRAVAWPTSRRTWDSTQSAFVEQLLHRLLELRLDVGVAVGLEDPACAFTISASAQ